MFKMSFVFSNGIWQCPKRQFQKESTKSLTFYLPNTILMKRFRKIQETQIVIIFASKCIGWTQGGGGGGKAVPPTKSFLSTPSFLLLLRSESKRRTKTSSRNGGMSPNLPSLQIPNERVFFPFHFFFFFVNASNIAYWRFFPSWKQLLTERRNEQRPFEFPNFVQDKI